MPIHWRILHNVSFRDNLMQLCSFEQKKQKKLYDAKREIQTNFITLFFPQAIQKKLISEQNRTRELK